jgi:hypothetical protein
MLHKTSLTNASKFCNRNLSRLLLAAAVLGLTMFCEPELNAQTTVGYLQQSPGHQIAVSPSSFSLGNCPPITFNPVGAASICVFGPFNLPGYAGSVYVGFSGAVPQLSWAHNQASALQSTSNNLYNWGADTDEISLYNTSSSSATYTIHFYFKGPAPDKGNLAPDPSSLFLVVAGLESSYPGTTTPGTTATVSAMTPLANPDSNRGEYTIPASAYGLANPLSNWCPFYPATAPCVGSAKTNVSAATCLPGIELGSTCFTFSGGATSTTDWRNTGWDIYQPSSPGLTELQLDVTQVSGDGIGFTLGYKVCGALVGDSLDSRTSIHLYDIDTATGVAANPRPIGANWSLAFSPMSPEGTLYAVENTFGSLPTNTLFTVNPSTGAANGGSALTPTPVLNRGGFAANPVTGILYGTDAGRNLFTVSETGAVTQIGQVPGATQIAAMAFDGSGNLFIVDISDYSLLKVSAPVPVNKTALSVTSTKLSVFSLRRFTDFAGLAIDPLSGKAYYTEGGYLYTLDLTNGSLSSPVLVTGAEDSGNLASLTFITRACLLPRNGAM